MPQLVVYLPGDDAAFVPVVLRESADDALAALKVAPTAVADGVPPAIGEP